MGRNYNSLKRESRDCSLALRSAYDRGYEQGKTDYERRPGQWTLKLVPSGGEYECSECGRRSMAPGYYCQICGSKMKREVLMDQTKRKVKV